jgi:hypothetical protein
VIRVAATSDGGGRLLMDAANLDMRASKIGVGQDAEFLSDIRLTRGGTPLDGATVARDYISNPNSTLYRALPPTRECRRW